MIREAFARRLRALLKEKRISKIDLARRVEVEKKDVARWLAGSLPIRRTMNRVAEALQVSPDWLEGGAEKRDTGGRERQDRDEASSFAQGSALGQGLGPEPYERGSQDIFQITTDELRETAKILNELIWFFSRVATETEAKAEDFRGKIQEFAAYRQKLRDEVAARHTELAPSVQQTVAWPIPRSLDDLLDRIRQATAGRGKKKALALFLEVSPNKVSYWLSKTERRRRTWKPSGEPTLRMLAWLQAHDIEK